MKTFYVKSIMVCSVTWQYEIEAEDESAALEKYWSGEHDEPISTEIGDAIGDSTEEVYEKGSW